MQDRPTIDKNNVSRFPCENCGADMGFDAAAGGLHCQYCGHIQAITVTGTVEERSYDEFLSVGTRGLSPMAVEAMQVQCSSCGAVINFTPPETATVCAFCGNRIVAQPKAADPMLAPNGVLPFLVTQRDAVAHFNRWLSSLWFAPSKLKHLADADKLVSIYIPYWTYDAATDSDYTGQRGENYQVTESYVQNGQTKYRTVTKIRWYSTSGRVARHFDDVCVPATISLPRNYLDRLEPWDLDALSPYEPAFLSGHKAEAYRVPLDAGFERFKEIAYSVIHTDCRRDIGGDHQRVSSINTRYADITFKHLLLPIYSGAYRFGGKTYQVVVNGRTGAVQGSRPYSVVKITALVIALVLVALILFFAFAD